MLYKLLRVSIFKDPRSSHQCSNNYRSLTIGTTISKIFDMILLQKHSQNLDTSDNQFGFKQNMSTSMCTFTLNETVSYYTKNGSSVYALFLDASKAFDRLNYIKLFEKLIAKGMCPVTVRALLNMYMSQKIQVKSSGMDSFLMPLEYLMVLDRVGFYLHCCSAFM